MRKFSLLLFLTIIALRASGQVNTPPVLESPRYFETYVQNKPIPILRGVIRNVPAAVKRSAGILTIRFFCLDREGDYTKKVKISPQGFFECKMDYALPIQQIALDIYDLPGERFFVSHDLFVDIDYLKLENRKPGAIAYNGADADLNQFIDAYNKELNNYNYKSHLFDRMRQSAEADQNIQDFLAHQHVFNATADSLAEAFINQHNNGRKYDWAIYNNLLADRYARLLGFYKDVNIAPYEQDMVKINAFKPRFQSPEVQNFYYHLNHCVPLLKSVQNQELFMKSLLDSLFADKSTRDSAKPVIKEVATLTRSFYTQERAGANTQSLADTLNRKLTLIKADYSAFMQAYSQLFNKRTANQSYYHYLENTFGTERADILFANDQPDQIQVGMDRFKLYYKKAMPQFKTTLVKTFVSDYIKRIAQIPVNVAALKSAITSTGADNQFYTYHKTTLPGNLVLYENDKIDGATILKQLVKHHQKMLFIDMWGTWCQGCLDRMPQSAILHSKVDTNKVAFVYLCNTSPKKDCLLDIVKFKMKGINIWLTQSQTKRLEASFKLSAYPTYIIIDKKGNINWNAAHLLETPIAGAKELNLLAKAR